MKYRSPTFDSPEKLFFTADTHFWHQKAAEMRGFANPIHMNDYQIEMWNRIVPKNATVVMLGDVSFAGTGRTLEVLEALNGKKILVRGNHDKGMNQKALDQFESVHDLLTVKVRDGEAVQRIVCCHFPMLGWDMSHHGAWHLHGHSHGSCIYPWPDAKILDVGIDDWDYPASYHMVKAVMINRKSRSSDYHSVSPEID